jgi:hypothetical protein
VRRARKQQPGALLLNALAAAGGVQRAAMRERSWVRHDRERCRIAGNQQPRWQRRAQLVVCAGVLQQRRLNRQHPPAVRFSMTKFFHQSSTRCGVSLPTRHATTT